jgi:molybdopterin synthase catalytic subunit
VTHCSNHIERMANPVCKVLLTKAPLKAPENDVDPAAGAVVVFWGVVRELEDGRKIEGIDYDAHQAMAEHQLQLVAEAATEKFQLNKVMIHHRVGFVRAGEPSLFLQVWAQHRAAAFESSKWIVDELKKKVPIWKRPRFKTNNRRRPGSPIPATAE